MFAIDKTDETKAIKLVNSFFDNTPNRRDLIIEIVETTSNKAANPPANYDPGALDSFTFVYGKGE